MKQRNLPWYLKNKSERLKEISNFYSYSFRQKSPKEFKKFTPEQDRIFFLKILVQSKSLLFSKNKAPILPFTQDYIELYEKVSKGRTLSIKDLDFISRRQMARTGLNDSDSEKYSHSDSFSSPTEIFLFCVLSMDRINHFIASPHLLNGLLYELAELFKTKQTNWNVLVSFLFEDSNSLVFLNEMGLDRPELIKEFAIPNSPIGKQMRVDDIDETERLKRLLRERSRRWRVFHKQHKMPLLLSKNSITV